MLSHKVTHPSQNTWPLANTWIYILGIKLDSLYNTNKAHSTASPVHNNDYSWSGLTVSCNTFHNWYFSLYFVVNLITFSINRRKGTMGIELDYYTKAMKVWTLSYQCHLKVHWAREQLVKCMATEIIFYGLQIPKGLLNLSNFFLIKDNKKKKKKKTINKVWSHFFPCRRFFSYL